MKIVIALIIAAFLAFVGYSALSVANNAVQTINKMAGE